MSTLPSVSDLRGAGRLAVDLIVLITDVAETMHANIMPGRTSGQRTRAPGITGFVYRRVRGVTQLAGSALDAVLSPLAGGGANDAAWPGRDATVGALNGVLGDHLEASGNPLAIVMELRRDGVRLPLVRSELRRLMPQARSRVVVMVHGLCMTDAAWDRGSHDHGRCLARDLDADTIHLRYNSGRHVSVNAAEFATLLEQLVAAWPVALRNLMLVGHSMGGLVIRGACATGEAGGHEWMRRLTDVVFLGTPHLGTRLERGGHGVNLLLGASRYTSAFARLGHLRSAGITDLRHGSVLERDWLGRDRFAQGGYLCHPQPLPRGLRAFAIAGSTSRPLPNRVSTPRGDGLVSVASALGQHRDAARTLRFAASRQWIAYETGHLDLLARKAVYAKLKEWLA